ncbi:hypothetical protein SK128_025363 [Halocaridina rubra]|uniref:Neurotransmitter-gated ion-channel ligand-binding domain-containing protein n=1 Tax=Halocaridina rubra TaxID=373956 RepID=A0AAN8XF31_HALRR
MPLDVPCNKNINGITSFSGYLYNLSTTASFIKEENFLMGYNCDFNLLYFPFDVHLCYINISLINRSNFKAFFQNISIFSGESAVGPFTASKLKFSKSNETYRTIIQLNFLLTRRYGAYILTTILPVILIGIIGSCSHKFESSDFTNRITIALSCLIVVASLIVAVSAGNSDTTEVRAIDVFFFYYTFRLFLMFACHVLQGFVLWGKSAFEQNPEENDALKSKSTRKTQDIGKILFSEDYVMNNEKGNLDSVKMAWNPPAVPNESNCQKFWEATADNFLLIFGLFLDVVFLGLSGVLVILDRTQTTNNFDAL